MRLSRLLAAALVTSVASVGVAACGPTEEKKSADAAPAAASPSPSGAAALSAADLIKKAEEANAKVTSVKLTFDVTSEGTHVSGTVAEDKSGNCVGQVSQGDQGGFDLMRSGTTVWLKPDQVFWEKSIGAGTSKTMAGKWLKGGGDNAAVKGMATFCDMGLEALKQLGKKEDGSDDTAGAVKGGTKQVGSANAVVITDKDGDTSAEIAIAAEGEPYLLEMTVTGKEPAAMTFTDFEKPVTVTPPPAAQVVDASKYLKG
ncbi:hypothetical protein [Kitasatospora cinereorecta]|uniref:Lipoprotein n=1 Tax=Kitasatospora cinereorecta TaxID=285560 RepID=A0ABW0VN20_9ACTN